MTEPFVFKPITPADYGLVASWLAQPHVKQWWHDGPATVKFVAEHYASDPHTSLYIAVTENKPIGVIQSYWVDDYPEYSKSIDSSGWVGIDLFIGELTYLGKGYGTQMIKQFSEKSIRSSYKNAVGVVADPSANNHASIRAFEKAGFIQAKKVSSSEGLEQLMTLKF